MSARSGKADTDMSGKTVQARPTTPRERILIAARELFYRQGIRAVGVEAVAEAAGTNKMTLYRHFSSKDELVAECLRGFARDAEASWDALAQTHAGKPREQLRAWLRSMADHVVASDERGCPLANAAIELPEKDHPARQVIEDFKRAQCERLVQLCRDAGLKRPEQLAEELFLLIEGARVSRQSVGPEGPGARVVRLGEAIIAAHAG
jgi:AcrR family transcriptional regulator